MKKSTNKAHKKRSKQKTKHTEGFLDNKAISAKSWYVRLAQENRSGKNRTGRADTAQCIPIKKGLRKLSPDVIISHYVVDVLSPHLIVLSYISA
ncbi:MAG: hypothetical protein ACRC53_00455 [Plesiomonas sp.]|uniref:hypothetical protein n=1 Tax=Plesiomonas sp. TaxID=2486279 RepID=UPI003F2ED3D9